jgi:hypothetical protein
MDDFSQHVMWSNLARVILASRQLDIHRRAVKSLLIMDFAGFVNSVPATPSHRTEDKCAVCGHLWVGEPQPGPNELHRNPPPRGIDVENLVDDCEYCQLLKSALTRLAEQPPNRIAVSLNTRDGLINVSGGGWEDHQPLNFMIYARERVFLSTLGPLDIVNFCFSLSYSLISGDLTRTWSYATSTSQYISSTSRCQSVLNSIMHVGTIHHHFQHALSRSVLQDHIFV